MAQMIKQIIGHEQQKQSLLSLIKKDQLPSSMIFQGPSGVGKKTLAKALLQTMNCPESDLACGHCSSCLRTLEEKNEFIYELKPEAKKVISVDQIRELHSYLSLKSLRQARMVVIDPADQLTNQAANALLKALEEAPEKTYFVLVTDRVFSLLATIRSRSHLFNFSKLSDSELAQAGQFNDLSIAWSDGRVSLADFLNEEKNVERLNESLLFLYSLVCEAPQDWKKKAPWFFSDDQSRQLGFNVWKQALEKRLYNKGKDLDWLPQEPKALSFIYESMEDLKRDLSANVEKQLAVENFYYQLRARI